MNDLVSIIIPVYKVEKYLDECMESLVHQTYSNLEIILVDDGSPDSSPLLCDNWAKKDARVKVIHKENSGVSEARNAGLDAAKGEYISFVDSDDVAEPNYIQIMYDTLQNHPDCGIVGCCAVKFGADNEKTIYSENWDISKIRYIEPDEYADRLLTMERAHTVWGKLFKKEVLSDVRFRKVYANEELFFALDLYPRIENRRIRVIEIPDRLYCYRINPNSIVHSAGNKFALTETACRERLLEEVRDKKPYVYLYYKKTLLLDYLSTIHHKLYTNSQDIPYYRFCGKLWKYSNRFAKCNLQRKEFVFYCLLKYAPSISYLVFMIKRLFSR